jgi:hypothetical protein
MDARVRTKVVAADMPMAVSTLFEDPMKGQSPRNCTRTKLFTRIALIRRIMIALIFCARVWDSEFVVFYLAFY